jgi:hypothetical protein
MAAVVAASAASNHSNRRVVHVVATSARRPVLEIGNVPGCQTGASPVRTLKHYHAGALRVVVTADNRLGVMKCARSAVAAGYRLHLVIQWWNRWKDSRIKKFFGLVLKRGQPRPWAVSIGNEQELRNNGGRRGISPRAYARIWRRVEPIIAARAPHAVRVAGEISPWHLGWLQQALADRLPGVQAVAGHPYAFPHTFAPHAFADWARRHRLPYWFDEGYRLRGVWHPQFTRTARILAGAAVIGAWLG